EGDPASDEITIVSEQTFPMGSSRFRFPIEVSEDSIAEPDKLFLVQAVPIYKPAGYTLVPGGTRIVVPANDNHVGFAGGRSDFSEGAGFGVDGTVDITLTLTNPAPAGGLPLSISSVPGADSPVTFTIMPEDGLAYTHTIDIKDDKLIDKTRRYDLVLGKGEGFPNDWGAPGGRRTHHLWIYQDDFGEIGFSSAASEDPVAEGSTHNVEIELSKALAPGLHAFVDIRAVESDGDTKNDVSFDSAVRVDPGVFELSFPVEIEDDGLLEGEEEVVLHLSPRRSTAEGGFPENSVTITQGTYTFKIAGNDNVIQFEAPTSVLVEEGVGTLSFKLKLTQPAPEGGLPVEIRLLDGNSTYATADDFILAEYGGPFTITPADGLEYTFSITIVDNDGPEGRESIRFELFPGDSFPDDWGAVADRPTVGGEEGSLYTIWIEAHNS
ncbi:MAG: hypothetical protein OXE98_05080, partial [Hyphomicrobiales bacterium]|nr:hypothetical protein [Hyphomicrobiales bacterium]